MDILNAIFDLLTSGWFVVIILAGAMFAAGVFIDEFLTKKQAIGTLVIISSLFGLIVMAVFATIAFFTETDLYINQNRLALVLLIGAGEIAWVIPYLKATYRRGAVVVGPMFQLIPVVGGVAEAIFIGIIPPMVQIIGAILIVVGGFVLSIEEEENEDGSTTYVSDWKTVGYMAVSASLAAIVYVLFKSAAGPQMIPSEVSFWQKFNHVLASYTVIGFWTGLGMVLTGIAIWIVWKPYRDDFNAFCKKANSKMVALQLVNETMDSGGAYMTHLANLLGPSVLVVTAFNAAQPIFILLFIPILLFLGFKTWDIKYNWKVIAPSILTIAVGTSLLALS